MNALGFHSKQGHHWSSKYGEPEKDEAQAALEEVVADGYWAVIRWSWHTILLSYWFDISIYIFINWLFFTDIEFSGWLHWRSLHSWWWGLSVGMTQMKHWGLCSMCSAGLGLAKLKMVWSLWSGSKQLVKNSRSDFIMTSSTRKTLNLLFLLCSRSLVYSDDKYTS